MSVTHVIPFLFKYNMKRNINTAHLTKAFIESRISQEDIVSKYLNIPIETVQNCIEHNNLIKSVFRDDDTDGSMGIAYNRKGRLKVRDFGGFGFFEDVYGVVAYVLSIAYERPISTDNKQDFYFILKHIYRTFADVIDNREHDYSTDDDIKMLYLKVKIVKLLLNLFHVHGIKKIKNMG